MTLSSESFSTFTADVLIRAKITTKRADNKKLVAGTGEGCNGTKQFLLYRLHECITEQQHMSNSQLTGRDNMKELYVDDDASD